MKGKAEEERQQARKESSQARAKSEQLQQRINEGVKREAARMEKEKKQAVKRESLGNLAKVGSLTAALALYCFIMTVIWLADRWNIVKTVPQWLVNRWDDIKAIWDWIVSAHEWAYKLLQPHMSDFIAKAIPFTLILAIAALIAYFGVYKGFCYLLEQWGKLWTHYEYRQEKLLKASVTVAILTVSMPLAVATADGVGSLNVLSWWLIYSIALNVVYHAVTYKQW